MYVHEEIPPDTDGIDANRMVSRVTDNRGQNIDDDIGENEDTNIFTQVEIYRAYQIRFLAEHLTRWFPELNEEIQKKSNHVFYQSIANITQQFLEQDLQILKTQLSNSVQ